MLVLYVLGRHPSHGYDYSAALLEEAAQWQDVVALPMNEGRVTRNKAIGGGGTWGEEAEIGLSQKVYMWFDLAHRLFPTARYISKGDDDMFLRVPLFVAHLRLLPRRGSTWGFTLVAPILGKRAYQVARLWLAGVTPCRGMWRRRWCRSSRCGAWRTCRTARTAMTNLPCCGFSTKTSWLLGFLKGR
ncbi:putative UDP-Gal or UDP-GlcNAc-dependent glycosyltransferase [Trypanosoma cruzi]|uniref:Putative UDP-Gal or UDP-GlcNAc-dependent glycosyltransferase n=1 Tax=Trypanosoma cruzi TaxID=5693 RepID=A0A2V2VS95_TRYCR|nr:putative UDP-Gal or UDP-GlcNAc-dependent glycosyltransferase [Trypanosoma cruzi]